jgi:hypothetical protein
LKYGPDRIRTCDQPVVGLVPIGLHFDENHRIDSFNLIVNDKARGYECMSLLYAIREWFHLSRAERLRLD